MRMKYVRWNSFFQVHHRKQSSSASHVHTYIYTSSLFKHNISSSQSDIEASRTNLFSSSVPISTMEVREFVENKRSLFTPLKVNPLVGFHVTSKGSEIQNLRAGHQSFYPHQARGTKWHTCWQLFSWIASFIWKPVHFQVWWWCVTQSCDHVCQKTVILSLRYQAIWEGTSSRKKKMTKCGLKMIFWGPQVY